MADEWIRRETVVQLARTHFQDPCAFHESIMARLEVEPEEYTPTLNVRVPTELWRKLEESCDPRSAASVVSAARAVFEASEVSAGE